MFKITKSLAVILIIVSGVAAATYAFYIKDSTTSADTTLSSGTFDIAVNDSVTPNTFNWALGNLSGMAPGDETNSASVEVRNTGDIDAVWFGYFNVTNPPNNNLDEAIYIKDAVMEFKKQDGSNWSDPDHFITDGRGTYQSSTADFYNALADVSPFKVVTLKNWNTSDRVGAGGGVQTGAIKPGYSYKFTFKLGFAPLADNGFQKQSLSLGYSVVATQVQEGALNQVASGHSRITFSDISALMSWYQNPLGLQN